MLERSSLALLALSVPLSAQLDLFHAADLQHIDWPSSLIHQTKERMFAGDVTGDKMPDLVLVSGGKVVVAYGPALYRSVFEVDFDANDLVLLPGPTPCQAQRMIVVNGSGLHELTGYDGGGFDDAPVQCDAPEECEGCEAWQGATRVLRGDTDGDGSLDLVGLSAAGDVLFLEDLATSPTHATLDIVPTVFDLAPLDWNGDGTTDVALLQSNGFRVREKDGDVLYWFPGSSQGGHLLTIRQEGLGRDRCAVIWANPGEQYLAVADSTGVETPLDITSFPVHAAATGDVNGDGDEDLYLARADSHTTKVLVNRSASESYTYDLGTDDAENVTVASGSVASGWTPYPVVHDLDQDGDGDLAVYVGASTEIVWVPSLHVTAADQEVIVVAAEYTYSWDDDEGHLTLFLDPSEADPIDSTGVHVTTWRTALNSTDLSAVAVSNQLIAWETSGSTVVDIYVPDANAPATPGMLVNVMRAVNYNPSCGIVAAGPSSAHAFSTHSTTTGQLEAEFGTGMPVPFFEEGEQPPNEYEPIPGAVLSERSIAPKDVQIVPAPPPVEPPVPGEPDPP